MRIYLKFAGIYPAKASPGIGLETQGLRLASLHAITYSGAKWFRL